MEENHCQYIGSMGFRKSCDLTSLINSDNVEQYDFSVLKDYDTLYIKTDALYAFSRKINNIKSKFILLTGCSDYTVPNDLIPNHDEFINFLNDDNLVHWFAQNCIYSHPKITNLPIGLDYHTIYTNQIYWGSMKTPIEQENELIQIKNSSKNFWEREIKIYSNCHFLTWTRHGGDRIDAINKIPKDLIYLEPKQIDRISTWKKQIAYSFVLSPHGNGLDCHRTWEALVLGCIPIVKKSPIDGLYVDLPVLIVNDWSEINIELLNKTVEEFKNKNFNYDKLKLNYWKSLFLSYKK